MKNYIILLILLLCTAAAHAQWTSSGSNLTNTTQNIGIGLTTPATRFDMTMTNPTNQAAATMTFSSYHSSTYPLFQINRARYVSSAASAVSADDIVFSLLGRGFINSGYRDVANIRFNIGASPGSSSYPGYITFHTTNTSSTTLSERMRITEAGTVGIGTTSPANTLDVVASTSSLRVYSNSAPNAATIEASASASVRGVLESLLTSSLVRVGSRSNHSLSLMTNDTDRMTILNDGRVGIATASPGASYKLDVNGYINATKVYVGGVELIGSNWTLASGNVYRSSGNVGIGATSPATRLHLGITSANTTYSSATNSDIGLTLQNSNTTNNNLNILNFADGNGFSATQVGTVVSNHTSHYGKLFFSTRDAGGLSQRMVIMENGDVEIGSMLSGNIALRVGGTAYSKELFVDSATPQIRTAEGAAYLSIFNHEDVPNGLNTGGLLVADDYAYATPAAGNMVVKGSVGIGTPITNNPNSYKLAVNGKIGAKDLQIETSSTTWPDYIFEKSYDLPALSEVEKYVNENKHLEGMPSAEDVKKNGYSVNELNEALLKKVEELTLYVIKQQKQIDELKKEVTKKKHKK